MFDITGFHVWPWLKKLFLVQEVGKIISSLRAGTLRPGSQPAATPVWLFQCCSILWKKGLWISIIVPLKILIKMIDHTHFVMRQSHLSPLIYFTRRNLEVSIKKVISVLVLWINFYFAKLYTLHNVCWTKQGTCMCLVLNLK